METIAAGEELSYRLQNLEPSNYYRIEITARNSLGNSLPAYLVFRTADFASDGSGTFRYSPIICHQQMRHHFLTYHDTPFSELKLHNVHFFWWINALWNTSLEHYHWLIFCSTHFHYHYVAASIAAFIVFRSQLSLVDLSSWWAFT